MNKLLPFMALCTYGWTLPKEETTLKKSNRILVNGRNYFNQKSFTEMCEALEAGQVIEVYIDCIGHSRNNYEQENYRKSLQQKYGDNIETEIWNGAYSYSYIYRLKEVPHETPNH